LFAADPTRTRCAGTVAGGGQKPEPELDRLSNILKSFNEQFGTLFDDADRVARRFREDIAPKVAADPAYQNAKLNTPQAARIEHVFALTSGGSAPGSEERSS
jgi:type I restriction enzyme R subunit